MDNQLECNGNCFRFQTPSSISSRSQAVASALQPSVHQETFRYEPIKPWQIRLLELRPGHKKAPLQANIRTATVVAQFGRQRAIINDRPVDYRALSYTWGSVEKDCSIDVDNRSLNVTANLHAALTALRDENSTTAWWIDAICINQSDLAERAVQVSNMLFTFQTAFLVEVWLGHETDASNSAIEYLRSPELDILEFSPPYFVKQHTPECRAHILELVNSLVDLYTRPWLRRSWVRQELYAAQDLNVRCGSMTLSWAPFLEGITIFVAACNIVWRLIGGVGEDARQVQRLSMDMRESIKLGGRSTKEYRDFIDVLSASQFYEATDERDKVYAVLGMCGVPIAGNTFSTSNRGMEVDYTRKMVDIWQDVTIHFMFDVASRPKLQVQGNFASGLPTTSLDLYRKPSSGWRDILNLSGNSTVVKTGTQAKPVADFSDRPSWDIDWSQIRDPDSIAIIRSANVRGSLFPYFKPGQLHAIVGPTTGVNNTLKMKCWVWDVVDGVYTHTINNLDEFIAADGLPERWDQRQFDLSKHARRAGTLSIASSYTMVSGAQALLPAAAKKGDVIVAMAPDVFPVVIRPIKTQAISTDKDTDSSSTSTEKKKFSLKRNIASMVGPSTLDLMTAVQGMRLAPMPVKTAKDAYQTQLRTNVAEKLREQGQQCVLIGAVIGHWDQGMRIPRKGMEKVELRVTLY